MTIKIDTSTEALFLNKTGTPVFDTGTLTIVSQWSKKSETFNITKTFENDRYLVYSVDFGDDFRSTHKNGIYWAKVGVVNVIEGSWFLLKIITEPGGQDGFTRYDSDVPTEERQADVYYRPNY